MTEFRSGLEAIHIVGKGPSWGQAPSVHFREHGEDVELWGVNGIFMDHKNIDRSFMVHDVRQEIVYEDRDILDAIRNIDHPIYMHKEHEKLGSAVMEFPAKWVMEQYQFVYYTNVVCWMLALAALLEPDAIHLWGIDMINPREYANERGAVEHWMGVVVGKGIPITNTPTSKCCTTTSRWGHVYGYIPRKKPNGLIYDLMPDFNGFNKPEILDDYVLITREEYEKFTGSNTSTGRVEGDTEQEHEEGSRQVASGVEC